MTASPNFPKLPITWHESNLEFSFPNSVGQEQKIFVRVFAKKTKPAAGSKVNWLFVVHGQAEQSDRHTHFPHYLNGCLEAVIAIDLPGHGKSSGKRGHIDSFADYRTAVTIAFDKAQDWINKNFSVSGNLSQAHFFGHSLGGLITLSTFLKAPDIHNKVNSIIVSAPALKLAFTPPAAKVLLAKAIASFMGSLNLDNELKEQDVSHDISVQQEYRNNPLNHRLVTPKFFLEFTKEMEELREMSVTFKNSIKFILPMQDPIIDYPTTLAFFKRVQLTDKAQKSLSGFPGFFHESFNEIGKERAFTALSEWITGASK